MALPRAVRFFGGIFEGAHDCGADRQHRSFFALCLCDCMRGGFGDFVGFDVDFVIFEALGAHRLERSQANVQC